MRWIFARAFVVWLPMLASVQLADAQAPPVSDQDAIRLIAPAYPIAYVPLAVGEFQVVGSEAGLGPNTLTSNDKATARYVDRARQFEAAGLVSVQERTDGFARKVVVSLTSKGESIKAPGSLPNFVSFPVATMSIEIVRNELVAGKVDSFRVIGDLVTYTPIDADMKDLMNYLGIGEHRKQYGLYKYDPFTKRWGLLALDLADADKTFSTHNVDDQLRRVQ